MKFKCINTFTTEEKGFFKKEQVKIEHDCLTKDKFYYGSLVPFGYLGDHTEITYDDIVVMVTDDEGDWSWYPKELFIAVGDS